MSNLNISTVAADVLAPCYGICIHSSDQVRRSYEYGTGTWSAETWPSQMLVDIRADSAFAPSQWETSLHCNAVSHWLGANLESDPSYAMLSSVAEGGAELTAAVLTLTGY